MLNAGRREHGLPPIANVPPGFPPMTTQVINLAGAAARFAKSGFRVVDQAEFLRRKAICAACPNWRPESGRCTLCGCNTNAKLRSAAESCPDKPPRWEKVTT